MKLNDLFEAKAPSEMTKAAIEKEIDAIEAKYSDPDSLPANVKARHKALGDAFRNGGEKKAKISASKEPSAESRVTAKKHGGDDAGSWAVFVDGKMKVNGLTKSEVAHHKNRFIKKLGEAQVQEGRDHQDKIDELGEDIKYNWLEMSEEELFDYLKKNVDDKYMSYLKGLSDDELRTVIDGAYYRAHNDS